MDWKDRAIKRLEREVKELIDCFRSATGQMGDDSLCELGEQIIEKVESALAEMKRNL